MDHLSKREQELQKALDKSQPLKGEEADNYRNLFEMLDRAEGYSLSPQFAQKVVHKAYKHTNSWLWWVTGVCLIGFIVPLIYIIKTVSINWKVPQLEIPWYLTVFVMVIFFVGQWIDRKLFRLYKYDRNS